MTIENYSLALLMENVFKGCMREGSKAKLSYINIPVCCMSQQQKRVTLNECEKYLMKR